MYISPKIGSSKVAVPTFRSRVVVITFCSEVSASIQQSISRIIRDCEQVSLFRENIVDSLLFRLGYMKHVLLRFEGVSELTLDLTLPPVSPEDILRDIV